MHAFYSEVGDRIRLQTQAALKNLVLQKGSETHLDAQIRSFILQAAQDHFALPSNVSEHANGDAASDDDEPAPRDPQEMIRILEEFRRRVSDWKSTAEQNMERKVC